MHTLSEITIFVDFTHIPPSRYLFQGADLEKCATNDTQDSSSGSSDNASLNHNAECEGPSTCINESRQPDIEGCDGTTTEGQENSTDIKSPASLQASSTTVTKDTDEISYNHNEAVLHDMCEPLNKKPKLD